jgi:hypothetical protein
MVMVCVQHDERPHQRHARDGERLPQHGGYLEQGSEEACTLTPPTSSQDHPDFVSAAAKAQRQLHGEDAEGMAMDAKARILRRSTLTPVHKPQTVCHPS